MTQDTKDNPPSITPVPHRGPGRPPGSTSKISGATILASVERYAGQRFEDLLAQGYVDSIQADDKPTRLQYEKMFLNKVVADRSQVEHTVSDAVAQAEAAWQRVWTAEVNHSNTKYIQQEHNDEIPTIELHDTAAEPSSTQEP